MQKVQSMSVFFLYALLAFITPIIVLPLTREAYEFPKLTFVYLIFCVIAAIFILSGKYLGLKKEKVAKVAHERESALETRFVLNFGGLRDHWLIYLSLLFLIVNVVSVAINFFSGDLHLYTAVWGYYGRYNGGLASLFVYTFLFLISISFLKKKDFDNLLNLALFSTVPICLYAFIQKIGFVDIDGIRLYSTFGQPNWLASYLVFFIPIVLYRALLGSYRILWFCLSLVLFAVVWLTFSLSGLLGVICGVAYLLLSIRHKFAKKYWLAGLVTLLLVLGFSTLFSTLMQQKLHDALIVIFNPSPQHYALSDPGFIRLSVWQSTVKMYTQDLKTVLFGIGPEQFVYQLPFFRANSLNYSSEWDFVINKPHNYFLEILVETGLLGLVVFCLIVIELFKRLDGQTVAGFVGLLVALFFGWPVVSLEIIFWVVLLGRACIKD